MIQRAPETQGKSPYSLSFIIASAEVENLLDFCAQVMSRSCQSDKTNDLHIILKNSKPTDRSRSSYTMRDKKGR